MKIIPREGYILVEWTPELGTLPGLGTRHGRVVATGAAPCDYVTAALGQVVVYVPSRALLVEERYAGGGRWDGRGDLVYSRALVSALDVLGVVEP